MMNRAGVLRALGCVAVAGATLMRGTPVFAQPVPEPIGPFAADVRVSLPRFPDDVSIASALGVASTNLPTRGLGLAAGVNWYPFRMGAITVGLGGEVLLSRGSRTAESQDDAPAGPVVNTRFAALSPQVSLNFGTGRGWSYLSGGLGPGAFTSEREDEPVGEAASRPRVLNYGGGARWFAKEHLAFVLDLRFYTIDAQEATIDRPAYPKMRMMVFSAGVSFK
ncbi:MAG TPA: hypothetical protein VD833_10955 [Vicinamibacterales bacterium]|nr:hypothetical protein [Vicinamibacterales bacterium]